jgi:H+/Cl- antiporter ClcA
VSAAFGAPIGGALFSYELSQPNTFWKFEMIWKVFLCCSMSVFTLGILSMLTVPEVTSWVGTSLKFGNYSKTEYDIDLPIVIIGTIGLGVIGGVLGSFFIAINTKCNEWRKVLLTKKWMKPAETALFCALTCTVIFWLSYITYADPEVTCFQYTKDLDDLTLSRGWCGVN